MKADWKKSTLGNVLSTLKNGLNCKQNKDGPGQKISRIESIATAYFDINRVGFSEISESDKAKFKLLKGDILFSHINSPIHVGKTATFNEDEDVYHGVNLLLMRPNEEVLPAYLELYLKSLFESGYWLKRCKQSVNQASVNQQDIAQVAIEFPSNVTEQHRIVTLLDEAFADIATAKANAEKNLQHARDFFAGQLQAVFDSGINNWNSSTMGQVYDVRDGTHDSPKYHDEGFPLITSKNLKNEGLSFDDVKLISLEDYNKINERSAVHQGDVLLAMIGTIGNPTVVETTPNFAIKNVALLKVPENQNSYFLRYYLSSPSVIAKMQAEAKGTTQKFVGLGYLRAFPISVPDLSEQDLMVGKIDELRAETNRLESIYRQKLTALDDLKKSLLHQAFSGKL